MTPARRGFLWAVAALLGIAMTAALTWSVTQLAGQRIGLSSEPLKMMQGLAPRQVAPADPDPAGSARHVVTRPRTKSLPTAPPPVPAAPAVAPPSVTPPAAAVTPTVARVTPKAATGGSTSSAPHSAGPGRRPRSSNGTDGGDDSNGGRPAGSGRAGRDD